jgi:hypothetical protein
VKFPTGDGRTWLFDRYPRPDKTRKLLLAQLGLPCLHDGAVVKAGDRILPGQISQGRWTAKEPVILVAGEAGLVIGR